MGETESVNHFESDNELQSDPSAEALKQRVTLQGGITEPKVENGAPSKDEALNKATDGDPKAKVEASTMVEAILHNPENVKASEPGGAYKVPEGRMLYKFISTGLEQLMAENPDFAKSRTIQTAYVLSKFFGEFLNFNVSPKEYSSFVDAVYPQETMNESEIKKTFEEKYGKNKDDTKDAYGFRDQCAKTSKDLEDAKGRLEKASAAQKDLLTEEVKFLENKQKNQEKIYKNLVKGKEKADTWEKFLSGLTDKEKDGLQKRSKEVSVDEFKGKEYADAKISAAYVSGVLGIKLEDNDPEKLYAKFLHTRYEDKTVADK
ncbi:MAG: hypothetical protein NTV24_03770, partial [Candidatus Woesebacteria bacterium]|nr:hypothetical protein [Candidatus Woesebacteria bacterium]